MKILELKDRIIYQIFPRSFRDSNNDGDGDLKGIVEKMDYIKELGVNAIGLCPTYDTDFADAGYDVKDYKSVGKQFGTLEDFKLMTSEAEKRGIDIIMDIVLNHVSSEHPWFLKALESEDNIEHNYFIGRNELNEHEKKADSIFGGSAGEFVPSLNKYYFHLFAKEQVDLNGDHEDTIAAMADIIDFGYEIGVKGFRLDAIKHISKVFPDGNDNAYSGGPTVVPQLQKFLKKAFDNKPDAFTLGEASGISLKEALEYGTGEKKVSSNYYNFSGGGFGGGETGRNGYDPSGDYKKFVSEMKPFQEDERIIPELMTNFLSNHDTSRSVSRGGDENVFGAESAKTQALMLFSLKGIPCVYYGEEIGMLNPRFKSRDEFRDVDVRNSFSLLVDEQKYYSEDEMTKYHNMNSRDNCRTPMQGDSSVNSGFNDGAETGIKLGHDYQSINVEKQLNDPKSILSFYKKIIAIRKSEEFQDILVNGKSQFDLLDNGLFQITRTLGDKKLIAIINMTDQKIEQEIPEHKEVLARSGSDEKPLKNQFRSYESILFSIK